MSGQGAEGWLQWLQLTAGAKAAGVEPWRAATLLNALAATLTSTTNDHVADHGTVDIQRILHRLAI